MGDLLVADEIREHVETDLGDDALNRIIDAQEAEIIDRLGPLLSQTYTFNAELYNQPVDGVENISSGDRLMFLPRRATSITSIVERYGETDYALASDDYHLANNGVTVERLSLGTNGSSQWRGQVTVVFVPADETARRTQLLIDLVKLAVEFEGVKSQKAGSVQKAYHDDYQAQRMALFAAFGWSGGRLPIA